MSSLSAMPSGGSITSWSGADAPTDASEGALSQLYLPGFASCPIDADDLRRATSPHSAGRERYDRIQGGTVPSSAEGFVHRHRSNGELSGWDDCVRGDGRWGPERVHARGRHA